MKPKQQSSSRQKLRVSNNRPKELTPSPEPSQASNAIFRSRSRSVFVRCRAIRPGPVVYSGRFSQNPRALEQTKSDGTCSQQRRDGRSAEERRKALKAGTSPPAFISLPLTRRYSIRGNRLPDPPGTSPPPGLRPRRLHASSLPPAKIHPFPEPVHPRSRRRSR